MVSPAAADLAMSPGARSSMAVPEGRVRVSSPKIEEAIRGAERVKGAPPIGWQHTYLRQDYPLDQVDHLLSYGWSPQELWSLRQP